MKNGQNINTCTTCIDIDMLCIAWVLELWERASVNLGVNSLH